MRRLLAIAVALGLTAVADAQPRRSGPRTRASVVDARPGRWLPRCVAFAGCVAPARVPRCAGTDAGPPTNTGVDGERVVVVGRVVVGGGSTTQVRCDQPQCCNDHHRTYAVAFEHRQYGLGGRAPSCRGDDSGLCCTMEVPTGDVRIVGVLRVLRWPGRDVVIDTVIDVDSMCDL